MSAAEEATINPDGTTSFPSDSQGHPPSQPQPQAEPQAEPQQPVSPPDESTPPPETGDSPVSPAGIDPALYLIAAVLLAGLLFYFFVHRKRSQQKEDNFFLDLDGDKFNFDLPTEVDAYYTIKEKCLEQGWKPGTPMSAAPQQISGPQRVLAQALMKRAIADIPIVQHIQKEASGMNKLYAQSMCSVQQWKSFQNAEAMIAAEIDSVRAEADALDPGWSQYVWKQAMEYHRTLKLKHEQEEKKKQDLANQRKIVEANVAAAQAAQAARSKEDQEKIAQQAAEELLKAEERDKQSKKAFSAKSNTMKKGFLENNHTSNTTSTSAAGTNSNTNTINSSTSKSGAKGKKKK